MESLGSPAASDIVLEVDHMEVDHTYKTRYAGLKHDVLHHVDLGADVPKTPPKAFGHACQSSIGFLRVNFGGVLNIVPTWILSMNGTTYDISTFDCLCAGKNLSLTNHA